MCISKLASEKARIEYLQVGVYILSRMTPVSPVEPSRGDGSNHTGTLLHFLPAIHSVQRIRPSPGGKWDAAIKKSQHFATDRFAFFHFKKHYFVHAYIKTFIAHCENGYFSPNSPTDVVQSAFKTSATRHMKSHTSVRPLQPTPIHSISLDDALSFPLDFITFRTSSF